MIRPGCPTMHCCTAYALGAIDGAVAARDTDLRRGISMHRRLLQLPLAFLCAATVLVAYPQGGHSQAKTAAATYSVKSGDTLHSIAEAVRPQEATTNQMALALLQANTKTFQSRDTLRLRSRTKLSVPDAKTV